MNVTDDEAVPESFHCIAKDVSADRLHDVLNEFRSVGFDAFPFLCGSYTFIGDRFSAVLIFTDSGLHIGEQTTGGELDEEHSTFINELDATDFGLDPLSDGCFYSTVDIPPEGCDHRVGIAPGIDQRLQFFFR